LRTSQNLSNAEKEQRKILQYIAKKLNEFNDLKKVKLEKLER
jgi:hypothetical protein